MDEKEISKKIDEIVERGGIVADLSVHFQETDIERIKQAAVAFASTIKDEKGVVYSLSEIANPEKNDDVYTTYVETRIVVKNLETLALIMMKYTPVGLEIVRPDKISVSATDLRGSLMLVSNNMFDLKNYIFKNMMTHEERESVIKYVNEKMKNADKLLKGGNDGSNSKN